MTGYGRAKKSFEMREITVEIRSVNHKFFEFSSRIPRQYSCIEDKLKPLFSQYISRGKVEVYINIGAAENSRFSDVKVELNVPLAQSYIDALRTANKTLDLDDDFTLSQVFRIPEVFSVTKSEIDENELWNEVSETAKEALDGFLAMRKAEGERLKLDLLTKIDHIDETVAKIEERSPAVTKEYFDRLYKKLSELLEDKNIDESRILTEAAIFADRTAVDEETVRLKIHTASFRELLELDEPIGKKLDFLVQEMNREINTTGSKCSDLTITKMVVDLKSTVEKIREQIQNIE